MKTEEKTKVDHSNHRQRLYNTIQRVGLDKANNYIALEFILTLVLPRVDTNPIAHKLIDKFGDIPSVLDASAEDLAKIPGMGPNSARLLSMFPDIIDRYLQDKQRRTCILNSREAVVAYCKTLLGNKPNEELYAICMNRAYKVLRVELLAKGTVNELLISMQEFLRKMISIKNNYYVVLTHSHPDSNCQPSREDRIATTRFKENLEGVGLVLLDHFIIGPNGYYCVQEDSAHDN
ncbi:MAG: hypothetical protein IKB21_01420 [Clostridia bacterium]|nr:hypothetical protein [Clostridia bacterium]